MASNASKSNDQLVQRQNHSSALTAVARYQRMNANCQESMQGGTSLTLAAPPQFLISAQMAHACQTKETALCSMDVTTHCSLTDARTHNVSPPLETAQQRSPVALALSAKTESVERPIPAITDVRQIDLTTVLTVAVP